MSDAVDKIAAIGTAVIGLAIVAVLVKNGSQTTQVIQATTQGFATIIGTAANPGSVSSPMSANLLGGTVNSLLPQGW